MISDAMVEAAYSTYCVKSGIFRTGERDRMGLMAMRAALEAAEAVRWRDVKTDPPPMDGTEVLLYGELIVDNDGMPNDGRQIGTERTVGWWDDGQWETDDPYVRCTPTHWMPLPPAPEAHDSAGDKK